LTVFWGSESGSGFIIVLRVRQCIEGSSVC